MLTDLATGVTVAGSFVPTHIFCGEGEISSSAAPALAALTQYQVCALTATGVTPFISGTHTKDQMVIATQDVASGAQAPIWTRARTINHAILIWPSGTALDTFAERLAFVQGTAFAIGKMINDGNPSWAS